MINDISELKVLITFVLGTGHRTSEDFRRIYAEKALFGMAESAAYAIDRRIYTWQERITEVDIVVVTLEDFGLKEGVATNRQVYGNAIVYGLDLCPAEVGPQMRWQYPQQPMYERLLIGMNPLAGNARCHREPKVFSLTRSESAPSMWLGTYVMKENRIAPPTTKWAFVRPRRP